jgi:hypothetical protein
MREPGRPSLPAVIILAALAAVTLGACARPFVSPILPPPYREQVEAPYDATWRALIRALAADNVPLRTVARDSGVISSDDIVSPIGVFADCGRLGAVALEGEALVTFTVFVQSSGGKTTELQVNAKMRTQAHRRGESGRLRSDPVYQCASTGRWEANLVDVVRRMVQE